ncbi:MAG: ABC transporter permease subunit [Flexistipes sinusarabici]|uniref:ABC transporter permease subunit n=1 Tax=Flexistipes sinusarabici TaxID=2352 RepID=A0A5D0MQM7_FLESI|nr:ABC transporter permease subunit [Flexistipes sinusarabici]TYB33079.1 MAG: ABC transporter permease subunit [Flexistipes sinusarabici]
MGNIPRIPLGDWIEAFINFLVDNLAVLTQAFSTVTEQGLDWLESAFLFLPPWLFIIIVAALTYWATKRKGVTLFALLGLLLIWNLDLWRVSISTLSLVIVATLFSICIGIPIGILAALYQKVFRIVTPILDFMQTLPAFVYLIPAISFFGLGKVPAIFATVIFSIPPTIRLTALGIRQVPKDLVECSEAFGSDKKQRLVQLQLPIAKPTIMAGVNQTIMLALSMVVIAAMIGAAGLGGEVWRGIQRLWVGRSFEAGIGIVIIAIILDRITQSVTK